MAAPVAFGRGPRLAPREKSNRAPVVRRRRGAKKAHQPEAAVGASRNITHPSVAFVFDPERDSALAAPYWMLGDDSMESETALAERASLRTHPAVQDALRRLGNAAFERDESGRVLQSEYLRVHARISRVLAPKMPEEDSAAAAEREWANDSAGQEWIDDSRISEALFQLVDLWSQTTEPEEYLSFLEALRFKLRFSENG